MALISGGSTSGGSGVVTKIYLSKPAANITRASTSIGAFSTAWQITGVVVASGQNVKLSATFAASNAGTANDYLIAIFRGASQIASRLYNSSATIANLGQTIEWVDENPGAGTYTYELQAAQFTSGTLTVFQTNITTDVAGGNSIFIAEVYTP